MFRKRCAQHLCLLTFLLLAVVTGLLLAPQTAWAACGGTTLCVDADATGTHTGLSWTNAYTNVQDALAATRLISTTDYDIWVAEGVYYPDVGTGHTDNSQAEYFTLSYNNVQLYGGFAATETVRTERDWDAHVTILSGDIDGDDINTDGNQIAETWDDIQGNNAYHVLYLDGVTNENITGTTVVDGFTITAGQANGSELHDYGGGLYCDGHNSGNECSPALTHVIFSGNQAVYGRGGGMFNYGVMGDSSPALTNVTFSGNQAGECGGGMYDDGGGGVSSPALTNVTFSGNQADYGGGGLYNDGSSSGNSSPALTNVTFSGNQAAWHGGGMYNDGGGGVSSPALTNVTFSGNQAGDSGGGMYNAGYNGDSSPALTNVTFSGNQADSGGGMYNAGYNGGNSSPALINVTFSGNQADSGGGMYIAGDGGDVSAVITNSLFISNGANHIAYDDGNVNTQPHFINSTFSGATSETVKIECFDSGQTPIDFTNVIFWGNNSDLTNNDAALNVQYSLVEESSYASGTGNVFSDPHFVNTAAGNYRLPADSPAIDAGDNSAVKVTTDLDGNPRKVDIPNVTDSGNGTAPLVDLGAYETQLAPMLTLRKTVTPTVDVAYHGLVTYTVSLSNVGVFSDTHVFFTDTLSSKVDFASWVISPQGTLLNNDAITWSGTVAAGEVLTWTFRATYTGDYGDIVANTAEFSGTLQTSSDSATFMGVDQAHLYVDADANGNATGLSWTDAYTNVQDALNRTNTHGIYNYEIWVAEGVYYPDVGAGHTNDAVAEYFTLSYNNVQLYGGFAATETLRTQRDWESHVTVLSGDIDGNDTNADGNHIAEVYSDTVGNNAYHVLWLDGVTHESITGDTVIDGFTITAGQANGSSDSHDYGGGLYCDGHNSGNECSPMLTNVTFSGNQATCGGGLLNAGYDGGVSSPALTHVTFSGNQATYGGGMFNAGYDGTSSPVLTNVTFSGNQASYQGGGMYNDGGFGVSSPALIHVTFSGNQATYGGGLYNGGSFGVSSPALTNVIFSGNQADAGGGMYNDGGFGVSSPALTGVIFSGNQADTGGGLYNDGAQGTSSPVLTHVTFSGNQATQYGGGMYGSGMWGNSSPALTNVILWGNTAGINGKQLCNGDAAPVLSYTLIQSGTNDIYNYNSIVTYGPGILTSAPQFVMPITATVAPTTTGNYRLQANSPAINAGDNSAVKVTTDLDGNPRVSGGIVDLGAYEVQYRHIYLLPLVLCYYP